MRSNPAKMPTMRSRCRVTKRSMGRLRMLRRPNTSSSERPWSVRRFYERADHRLLWLRPSPRWVSVSLWPENLRVLNQTRCLSGMNRRDFLLLRAEGRSTVLSCERLYMRFLDSQLDGTTSALFENLARDLRRVNAVRLVDPSWLSRDELRAELELVLDAFQRRGGRVER